MRIKVTLTFDDAIPTPNGYKVPKSNIFQDLQIRTVWLGDGGGILFAPECVEEVEIPVEEPTEPGYYKIYYKSKASESFTVRQLLDGKWYRPGSNIGYQWHLLHQIVQRVEKID